MIISDSHTDFLTAIKTKKQREQYVKSIAKFRPTICAAVFTTNKNMTFKKLKSYKQELEFYNKKYHTNFLLTIEDLGFVKSVFELEEVIKLKPFAVTLTWNNKNQFASGAHACGGITKFGKSAIKLLEQNGVLIDCAHLNRRSFWQFTKFTNYPIFVSHTNVNSIFKNKRNLTDAQIKCVAKTGGYIGITLYQKFVANRKIFAKDIANQFVKLKELGAINNCGFGTDLFGIEKRFLPADVGGYKDLHLIKKSFKKPELKNIIYCNFLKFVHKQKSTSF